MQAKARVAASFGAPALAASMVSVAACAQTAERPAIDSMEKLGRRNALTKFVNLWPARRIEIIPCAALCERAQLTVTLSPAAARVNGNGARKKK
jgi:hypothetical protein